MQGRGWRAGSSEWQELDRSSPWGLGRNVRLLCCLQPAELQEAPERPAGLGVPLPGEIYWNKPWPCRLKLSLLQQMHGELITAELGLYFCLNPWRALGD